MTHRTGIRRLGLLLALTLLLGILPAPSYSGTVSMLERGPDINSKMKALASGTKPEGWVETGDIKAIRMAESLPGGFVPSAANTVSAEDSELPTYIFFDNEEEAGILYFYTEADTVVMHPDSYMMFSGNLELADISGVTRWDSSRVTSMYGMFANDKSLPDALALRYWDTSAVTDMSFMFSGASALAYIDVSRWNTGKVTTMSGMFQVGASYKGDGQLREILGICDLDVSNVRDMTCMFYGAGQMSQYDIADWDVSKVESMNHMFCDNFSLRSLDLSRWDVSSVKTMYCMFDDCHTLKMIGDVSRWNTASLIDAGGWLNYASSFIGDETGTLDLSGWNTGSLKAAGEMFLYTKIHTIDLSGWTFDSVTNDRWEGAGKGIFYEIGNGPKDLQGFGSMFKGTTRLTAVYVSQEGLESFNAAVEREVNTLDMWTDSKTEGFTVK